MLITFARLHPWKEGEEMLGKLFELNIVDTGVGG